MSIYLTSKDNKARHIVAKFEASRFRLQFFLRNSSLSLNDKYFLNATVPLKFKKMSKFSVRSRNRCVVSGRAGSIFRYFRLSRIRLKQLASRGFLTGVRKSSW